VAHDLETLFARAQAATLRARQLVEILSVSQNRLKKQIATRRMRRFTPTDRKISYPQDYPEQHRTYQPIQVQTDET
jgi:hypothetical protein